MNNVILSTRLMGVVGIFLLPVGIALFVYAMAGDEDSFARRWFRVHVDRMQRMLDEMFMPTPARDIAMGQVLGIVTTILAGLMLGNPMLFLAAVVVAIGPELWLTAERKNRVTQMEEQLAQWLMLLANALRATPSVGASVEASAKLVPVPLRHHVELVVKEMRLGVPVEAALMSMARRIDSQTVQSALATVVISQRTGGDVPRLLEESASGLREMARLEGIIRAKTAEGKSQAIVLAAVPAVLMVMIDQIKPGWFTPLVTNPYGYAIMAGAALLWFGSIFMASRILAIEV